MRQNEKRIYSGWELLNANEISSGTPIRLRINPLPAIFGTLIVFAMLYGCYLGGEVSVFLSYKNLRYFLLIPKVLNLPILQDRGLYSTVGYLVFGYIGFVFFSGLGPFYRKDLFDSGFSQRGYSFLGNEGSFRKKRISVELQTKRNSNRI